MKSTDTIEENAQYSIQEAGESLVFTWHHVSGLSIADMADGVRAFAELCERHRPGIAVIDARALDQSSPGFLWVSGQKEFEGQEAYMAWWGREILPVYNRAGVAALAVATGNPEAPGALPESPPGANFRMGYFNGLEQACAFGE